MYCIFQRITSGFISKIFFSASFIIIGFTITWQTLEATVPTINKSFGERHVTHTHHKHICFLASYARPGGTDCRLLQNQPTSDERPSPQYCSPLEQRALREQFMIQPYAQFTCESIAGVKVRTMF